MKKFLVLFFIAFISLGVNAEVYKYKSESFSYKTLDNYGYWSEWSDWVNSSVLVVVDIDKDVIRIYSEEPQEFDILYAEDTYDSEYNAMLMCQCVDADGVECQLRIRANTDGTLQLYVDYSNIMYVYNIYKR